MPSLFEDQINQNII